MSRSESRLFELLFTNDGFRDLFSDRTRIQRMLDFESALACAEAAVGLIPEKSAEAIAANCRAELFDVEKIGRQAVLSGNFAIPLVEQLRTLVRTVSPSAATYVHWGATSQDAVDTGMVLQVRDAIDHIDRDLLPLCDALSDLARKHKSTLLAGRTWFQHAVPISAGLKFAGWLDAIQRHRERLVEVRSRVLVVQFGGAAGTLAALESKGLEVAERLARELELRVPLVPWHSSRDRFVETATVFAMLSGTLGKMARDISLAMQTEVDELREPLKAGKGTSSTMPQKRNPVDCSIALAAAVRVPGLTSTMLSSMVQDNERAAGIWQAEWETLTDICLLTGGALSRMLSLIGGIEVRSDQMAANVRLTRGRIMSEAAVVRLAERLRADIAREILNEVLGTLPEETTLATVLTKHPEVNALFSLEEIDRILDPQTYLGVAEIFVEQVLKETGRKR